MAGAEDLMLPVQRVEMDGGALLFPLGAQFTVTGRSAAAVALRIPLGAAADLAEENTGLPAADLRFESMAPVSAAVGGLFTQTASFISGELVTSGLTEVSPLVVQEIPVRHHPDGLPAPGPA